MSNIKVSSMKIECRNANSKYKYEEVDNYLQNELIDVLYSVFKTTDGLFSVTIDATNAKDGLSIDFNWDSGASTIILVSNDE